MGDDNDDNDDDDDDHEFTSPREKFVFNEIMKEVISFSLYKSWIFRFNFGNWLKGSIVDNVHWMFRCI